MEGLSTAASAIAVVSVAVQLADSVKKLYDFWESIQGAPEDIRDISADLQLLSDVLSQIACEAQHIEPDATLVATLRGCSIKIEVLTRLLDKIEPGFASIRSRVRKWTAFKAVLKRGQLFKFQEALERLKCTLLLVQSNQYSRISRNRHISVERYLCAITQNVSSLSIQQPSNIVGTIPSQLVGVQPNGAAFSTDLDIVTGGAEVSQTVQNDNAEPFGYPRKQAWVKRTTREGSCVVECFLGTVRAETKSWLKRLKGNDGRTSGQDHYERETSCIIYPATWLIRLGFNYGLRLGFLSSPTQGWGNTLRPFCPVPDNALIFTFCREGNLSAVRTLLSEGRASVGDTNSEGYTPLHLAAEYHHSDLCNLLNEAGADMNACTYEVFGQKPRTALELATSCTSNTGYATLSRISDIIRLLRDSMDFLDETGSGWRVLCGICKAAWLSRWGNSEAQIDLTLWTLKLSSFEMRFSPVKHEIGFMLYMILEMDPGLQEASDILVNLGGAEAFDNGISIHLGGSEPIDNGILSNGEYSILQILIAYVEGYERISAVLRQRPYLHRQSVDHQFSPQPESPTSLAMYSSKAFVDWMDGLATIEVDTKTFVEQELEKNHAVHAGWEKETMLDLFAYAADADLYCKVPEFWCGSCCSLKGNCCINPYWRHMLERIKRGLDPDDPAEGVSIKGEVVNTNPTSIAQAANSSSDSAHQPEDGPLPDHSELSSESDSDVEWELDIHGYPATVSLLSDCVYAEHEIICMDCWRYYVKTGTRRPPDDREKQLASDADEDSSSDEYSPFQIHS